MQADVESGIFFRKRHCRLERETISHHAGARYNPFTVGTHNSRVDSSSEPKVISCDDKPLRRAGVCHLQLRTSFHAKPPFVPYSTRSTSQARTGLAPAGATNPASPGGCPE